MDIDFYKLIINDIDNKSIEEKIKYLNELKINAINLRENNIKDIIAFTIAIETINQTLYDLNNKFVENEITDLINQTSDLLQKDPNNKKAEELSNNAIKIFWSIKNKKNINV